MLVFMGMNKIPSKNLKPDGQYSLAKILMIFIIVTLPMYYFAWVLMPKIAITTKYIPGIIFWWLMIIGMVWQFVVSIILLLCERRDWTIKSLKERLWLNMPHNPKTGLLMPTLMVMLIPALLFNLLTGDIFSDHIDGLFQSLFPNFIVPEYMDIRSLVHYDFKGQWWLLGIAIISCIFNYVLGEFLLFHGVLLPKMSGVFGKWAWLANAILFGFYHLHLIWRLPSIIISNIAYSFPSQRYKSNYFALIVHGIEGVILLSAITYVIL